MLRDGSWHIPLFPFWIKRHRVGLQSGRLQDGGADIQSHELLTNFQSLIQTQIQFAGGNEPGDFLQPEQHRPISSSTFCVWLGSIQLNLSRDTSVCGLHYSVRVWEPCITAETDVLFMVFAHKLVTRPNVQSVPVSVWCWTGQK